MTQDKENKRLETTEHSKTIANKTKKTSSGRGKPNVPDQKENVNDLKYDQTGHLPFPS